MKKILIISLMSLFLAGCSNNPEKIYDNKKSITGKYDTYSYQMRKSKYSNDTLDLSYKSFSGVDTLAEFQSNQSGININYEIVNNSGKIKLLLVDEDKNIAVLQENQGVDSLDVDGSNLNYKIKKWKYLFLTIFAINNILW